MENEVLEFEGKKYVSSGRAGMLVGYTKDYVGQLARAGKLEAKLIGRSWYVSEDSIRKHKLGVHYTLTKPKKQHTAGTQDKKNEISNTYIDISRVFDKQSSEESRVSTLDRARKEQNRTSGSYGSHAILQADIRYEQGESLSFEDGCYVPLHRRRQDAIAQDGVTTHKESAVATFDHNAVASPVQYAYVAKDTEIDDGTPIVMRTKQVDKMCIDGTVSVPMRKNINAMSAISSRGIHGEVLRSTQKIVQNSNTALISRQKEYFSKGVDNCKPYTKKVAMRNSDTERRYQQVSKLVPVVSGVVVLVLYTLWWFLFF